MNGLYARLARLSQVILDAIALGLGLDEEACSALNQLISDRHCQLRLLHYPPIRKDMLQKEVLARLPAHRDWG
jgi:isopenicillin N synthase-like dioxygenase